MGAQFLVPDNNYSTNMEDHWPQITVINRKIKCDMSQESSKFDTETPSDQILLEKWHQ